VVGGKGWGLKNAPKLKFLETRMVGRDILIKAVREKG
jgi:hypothetical protein